jgi:hypothetical protein
MEVSRQLKEIASWRIATELIRRHPTKLALIETHPCTGQYDCLRVVKRDRPKVTLMDLNRVGSLHIHQTWQEDRRDLWSWPEFWEEMSSVEDPKVLLDRIEQGLGLSHHGKPPVSNGEVLAYRVIAALLSTAAYGPGPAPDWYGHARWECRNGMLDSDVGSGPIDRYFAEFPATSSWLCEPCDVPFGIPHYGFWFLTRDDKPVLCLHVTGRVADHLGNTYDLVSLYQQYGRILPMAVRVAGSALR